MPLDEWIKEFYLDFLKNGWKLEQIDEMDIEFYFDLANQEEEKEIKKRTLALDNAGL